MTPLIVYAILLLGISTVGWLVALGYLARVTSHFRDLRSDMTLLSKCIEIMGDEQRRSHYRIEHPEEQRERRAA